MFVEGFVVRTRVDADTVIQNFGEGATDTGEFIVEVHVEDQAVGVQRFLLLFVEHDVGFNAQVVVPIVNWNSVLVTEETFLSLVVHYSIHVVTGTLVLDVV